jgi:hypothetical protein
MARQPSRTSEYVLVVENLAPITRAADVHYEMEYWGPVRRCERDRGLRMALVEYDRYAPLSQAIIRTAGTFPDRRDPSES